jgi:hypothetical protein
MKAGILLTKLFVFVDLVLKNEGSNRATLRFKIICLKNF